MTYEEAKAKIEGVEGGAEALEVVRKNASADANKEAQGLRTRLRGIESQVRKLAGAEDGEKLEDAIARLEQGLAAGSGSDERTKRLEASLAELKGKLELKDKEALANKARTSIRDALTAAKGKGVNDLVRLLEGEKVSFQGDELMFEDKDGALVPVATFIEGWKKERPHFFESTQQPGPGADGTRNQTPGGPKSITRTDYERAQREGDRETLDAIGAGKIRITD